MKYDLTPTPDGLVDAWSQIIPIVRKQQTDPTYRYMPDVLV